MLPQQNKSKFLKKPRNISLPVSEKHTVPLSNHQCSTVLWAFSSGSMATLEPRPEKTIKQSTCAWSPCRVEKWSDYWGHFDRGLHSVTSSHGSSRHLWQDASRLQSCHQLWLHVQWFASISKSFLCSGSRQKWAKWYQVEKIRINLRQSKESDQKVR